MKKPDSPEEKPVIPEEVAWSLADKWYGDERTDMAGFNKREQEEFLLAYGPRKVRRAMRARRRAREIAQKSRRDSHL